MINTQPVCVYHVFVVLGIQHATRKRHIFICGLPYSTIFFHIFSWTALFKKKKSLNTKCVFLFPLQLLSETFRFQIINGWGKIKNEYWYSRKSCPILTFQSLLVTWCTNSLTFNNCTFCPHCIYVFCIYLRTNSDLCHLQHKLIGFW